MSACLFDTFHDLGDPAGVAAHILESLAPDGTLMLVEPASRDRPEDNLASPTGRFYLIGSTVYCVPVAQSQEGGLAIGSQAGPAATRDLVTRAGFRQFRRVAETPFQVVYEARP